MKAAIVTDNLSLKSFGGMLGFKVFSWNEISDKSDSLADSPALASELLKLLGFQGKIIDTSIFEIVFVHVGANTKMNDVKDIELVNQFVGNLLHMAESESDIGSRLHMSVIMSYGAALGDDDLELSVSNTKPKNDTELSLLFPLQSYMMKAGKPRENIRYKLVLSYGSIYAFRVYLTKAFTGSIAQCCLPSIRML